MTSLIRRIRCKTERMMRVVVVLGWPQQNNHSKQKTHTHQRQMRQKKTMRRKLLRPRQQRGVGFLWPLYLPCSTLRKTLHISLSFIFIHNKKTSKRQSIVLFLLLKVLLILLKSSYIQGLHWDLQADIFIWLFHRLVHPRKWYRKWIYCVAAS